MTHKSDNIKKKLFDANLFSFLVNNWKGKEKFLEVFFQWKKRKMAHNNHLSTTHCSTAKERSLPQNAQFTYFCLIFFKVSLIMEAPAFFIPFFHIYAERNYEWMNNKKERCGMNRMLCLQVGIMMKKAMSLHLMFKGLKKDYYLWLQQKHFFFSLFVQLFYPFFAELFITFMTYANSRKY